MGSVITSHASAFGLAVARLCVWLALLTSTLVPIERLFTLRTNQNKSRNIPADLAFYFLNSLLPALIIAIPISMLIVVERKFTPLSYIEFISSLPLSVKLTVGLIIGEICSYWGHRWSHKSAILWRFHALHHAPDHIDWLVNVRAHPFDIVFIRLCGLIPLYALGLGGPNATGDSSMVPVYITLVGTIWPFFVHANVRWRFGLLEQLVATPAFHHWHHSNDEFRDHNYAALFPWVDRLFGTHHLPGQWPEFYGVDDSLPSTFVGQLLHPWLRPRDDR